MFFSTKVRRKGNSGSRFRDCDVLFPRITPSLENGKRGYVMCLDENAVAVGSDTARPMFVEIGNLAKQNALLAGIRDAVLPRFIPGKLKVDHLDIQLPPSMREKVTV